MNNRDIEKMLGTADPAALTAALSESDRELLSRLIRDPAARAKFLSSKEAEAILRSLNRGDNNGRT